jgi:hypothetical protein
MQKNKFTIKTIEGDILNLDEIKGCAKYHVPLKEIVRYEWSEVFKRMIPIHAIEVFEVKMIVRCRSVEDYDVQRYLKHSKVVR